MTTLRTFCSRPNTGDFGTPHHLAPLWETPTTQEHWETTLRVEIHTRWRALLGKPALSPSEWMAPARKTGELEGDDYRVTAYLQPSGPNGQVQKVLILHPKQPASTPAPCAIIPYYHPEAAAGLEPDFVGKGLKFAEPHKDHEAIRYGVHLARLGFVVACVEAFAFNMVPHPGGEGFAWWEASATSLLEKNLDWSGIDKLRADTSLALDLLLAQSGIDPSRVLAMGHSLGGKMAFYTSVFDPRITAMIGSDFGLPWRSTNWDAIWYHGPERLHRAESERLAHHQLLALLAPRPFLLLAGEADDTHAWQYLEAARPAYDLYNAGDLLGCLHHHAGHRPPLCALDVAYGWLAEIFCLPHRRWR